MTQLFSVNLTGAVADQSLDDEDYKDQLGQGIRPFIPGTLVGSPQQEAVWDCLVNRDSHLVVEALAGTGKTTTLVEGLKRLPKQMHERTAFVAFNKSIATELQSRVPRGVRASTLHSMGFAAIRKAFGNVEVEQAKTELLLPDRTRLNIKIGVRKLVSLCKGNLLDGTNPDELEDLAIMHNLDLNGDTAEVIGLVAGILEWSMKDTNRIDYDDMIWLPVVLNLPLWRNDLLMVDESQDLNFAQQELVLKAGKRIVVVGDRHQAIYGFRGADTTSMDTLAAKLTETGRQVEVWPLTVTRRCPHVVVAAAQHFVPEFEAHETAGQGIVRSATSDDDFLPGDMVLCRVNAPIVSEAYGLIKRGVPARIQGRDIGQGLTKLVKKLCPDNGMPTSRLFNELNTYHQREADKIARRTKSQLSVESRLAALKDKVDCIYAVMTDLETVGQVLDRITFLFADTNAGDIHSGFVLLSSVHRAKGLEADRVHILCPDLMPHPMAKQQWEKTQERNIAYVAVTRAKNELIYHGQPGWGPLAG